jgi:Protein of unknown function (DUF4236)
VEWVAVASFLNIMSSQPGPPDLLHRFGNANPSLNCLTCSGVTVLKLSILKTSGGMRACNRSSFSAADNSSEVTIWGIFSSMGMVPQVSFRFRKCVRLGKFLHVNLAHSGASLSVGRRGARVNLCSSASILCSSSSIPRAHLCTGRHHRKARTAAITARTSSTRSLMKLRKF